MSVFDDVDDKLYAFESLFHDVINKHAPLKQVPYLTDEWRKAIIYGKPLHGIQQMQIIFFTNLRGINAPLCGERLLIHTLKESRLL